MQLTPKKLKVTANITMAYIINYMKLFCDMSESAAFRKFIKSHTYCELMRVESGLCMELAPDVLLMFADESEMVLDEENFDSFNDAFSIDEKLQYIVNTTENFREYANVTTEKYSSFIRKYPVRDYIENHYKEFCKMPKNDLFSKLKKHFGI